MTLFEAVVLGIVQGVTEFLPVSSSGHLAIARALFAITEPSLLYDVLLHFATVLAVLVFFWKDLLRLQPLDLYKIVLASIPAGVLGILFEDRIEQAFGSTLFVGVALLVTAALVIAADRSMRLRKDGLGAKSASSGRELEEKTGAGVSARASSPLSEVTTRQAVVTGLFQAFALLPGISRSGSTVAGGILSGIPRETAFRFSFIMVIPVILGATALQLLKASEGGFAELQLQEFAVGGMAAFIVGLLSLRLLQYVIRQSKLSFFGAYAGTLGVLTILFTLLSK
jgi:undecaprenyl-diphosphatase